MDLNALTVGELKDIAKIACNFKNEKEDTLWEIGKNYLIRTVTMILTGKLIAVTPQELWLTNAAWVGDTVRYSNALQSCSFEEVEPYPTEAKIPVGRGALIDACRIETLPRDQK